MSAKSKGDQSEREAVEEYLTRGWQVYRPVRCSRYADKDVFNMFDFIALRGDELDFVQVKSNRTRGFLKVLEQWRAEHPIRIVRWLLMVRQDLRKKNEKWRIYT